jgi:hypothetical protein
MTRGPQIFQTYRSQLTILWARKVKQWNFISMSIKLCMLQGDMAPWVYTHLIMVENNIFCLIEYCISGKLDKVHILQYMVQIFKWKYAINLKYFNDCYKRPKYKSDNVFENMGNPSPHGLTVPVGLGLLTVEVPWSHTNTSHSLGLLWTSDRFGLENSTWQHTTLTRETRLCPWQDSNPQSQKTSGSRPTP